MNASPPLARVPYPVDREGRATLAVREARPPDAPKPRLLDRVREALRARYYSRRTEQAYVAWIRRFIFFHGKRHPAELGAPEVTRFLTALAVAHVFTLRLRDPWTCALFSEVREA